MKQVPTSGMHPMLSSVVHLPFQAACKEIGCGEFAEPDFNRSMVPHLHALSSELPIENLDTHKLWHSMMNGEVIAVECADTETFVFHVRGKVSPKYVDMRFTYFKDTWDIKSITSIHSGRLWHPYAGRLYAGVTGGILLAGVLGFLLAGHGSSLNPQTVDAWAAANGYQLVKKDTPSPAPATSTGSTKQVTPKTATMSDTRATPRPSTTAKSAAKTAPQNLSFDFRSRMTVHDISVFLAQHHLVSNAVSFDQVLKQTGVDKKVWPGTYTFKSGMSQSEILQELQSKPSH